MKTDGYNKIFEGNCEMYSEGDGIILKTTQEIVKKKDGERKLYTDFVLGGNSEIMFFYHKTTIAENIDDFIKPAFLNIWGEEKEEGISLIVEILDAKENVPFEKTLYFGITNGKEFPDLSHEWELFFPSKDFPEQYCFITLINEVGFE